MVLVSLVWLYLFLCSPSFALVDIVLVPINLLGGLHGFQCSQLNTVGFVWSYVVPASLLWFCLVSIEPLFSSDSSSCSQMITLAWFWSHLAYLAFCGPSYPELTLWSEMVIASLLWLCLALFGPKWFHLPAFDSFWPCIVPACLLWFCWVFICSRFGSIGSSLVPALVLLGLHWLQL